MPLDMTMETIRQGFSEELPGMIYRRLHKIGIGFIFYQDRSMWLNPDGKTNVEVRYIYPSAGIPYVMASDRSNFNMPTICLRQEANISMDSLRMGPKGFYDIYESVRQNFADGFCREMIEMIMPLYDNPDPCVVEVYMRRPMETKSYQSHYSLKENLHSELSFSIFSPNTSSMNEELKSKYIPLQPNLMDIIAEGIFKENDNEDES